MALAHAMWVHGNAVREEAPNQFYDLRRLAPYVRIYGTFSTSRWLHFGVPTPVIVSGRRLRAHSAMVRMRTVGNCSLAAVNIYDGEAKIAEHDGLALKFKSWQYPRFEIPDAPKIRWGVGISILIKFGQGLQGSQLAVYVSSVGCDFID